MYSGNSFQVFSTYGLTVNQGNINLLPALQLGTCVCLKGLIFDFINQNSNLQACGINQNISFIERFSNFFLLFGALSSQSITQIIIDKSALTAVGLSPSTNNTAESLLVAILLKANQVTFEKLQVRKYGGSNTELGTFFEILFEPKKNFQVGQITSDKLVPRDLDYE